MERAATHRILVCTSCKGRHDDDPHPGPELIAHLRARLDRASNTLPEPFEVAGVACMGGCKRPCAIAYQAVGKASYLFGDIELATDLQDLVGFAHQYALLHDGMCTSIDRPGKLRHATLARLPAMSASPVEAGQ